MELLLGSFVEVVLAKNPCLIGLKGLVVAESQSKSNDSLVIYDGKYKRISSCLLKIGKKFIWSPSRRIRLIKKVKLKLSTI